MDIELRRLTENELELMMKWRMREDIANNMFSSVELTIKEQRKWFKKLQSDRSQVRWIIFADNIPIGSMYLVDIDYTNKRCESGWFVAEKEYRSFKLAMSLQQNMYDYVFDEMGFNRLCGYALGINSMLLKLVKLCGMEEEGILRQHIYKDGIFHDVTVVGLTKDQWQIKKQQFNYNKYFIE